MKKGKNVLLTAGLVLAILTLTNCGEVGCDPTRDSWCEENDSSSSIGGGNQSSSSGGGLPLSSSGGNSSSSVGGGSSSSVGGGNVVHGEPVNYGGETYPTVVIGTQTWFAKNLNYNVEGSKCVNADYSFPDEDTPYCDGYYGRLYNWATAMALDQSCIYTICSDQIQTKHKGICPVGWHLPSGNDWSTMAAYVGYDDSIGKKLKATSGWRDNGGTSGNGTDNFGFSALPGGHGLDATCIDEDGQPCWGFSNEDGGGSYWSSTEYTDEYNGQRAYRLGIYYDHNGIAWRFNSKFFLYSVRCVKD